jgi:hypothetical protein
VGHGRQGGLGDAISTLLEWQGWDVTREFYYNDAGNQIANLALSVQAASGRTRRGREMPAGRLPRRLHPRDRARYVADRSATPPATTSSDPPFRRGIPAREQDMDLRAFGVKFDRISSRARSTRRQGGRDGEPLKRAGTLRVGGRAVAADHGLRRRQGPRDAQVRRHVHVLRARRRVSPHASSGADSKRA